MREVLVPRWSAPPCASGWSGSGTSWPARSASASCSRTIPIRTPWPAGWRSAPLLGRTRATAPLLTFGRDHAAGEPGDGAGPGDRGRAGHRGGPPRASTRWPWSTSSRAFCEEALPEVAVVIDHHPEAKGCRAAVPGHPADLRGHATILTEYLRAADVKITERVATALFYGIKTDTLHLERGGTRADMEAFELPLRAGQPQHPAPDRAARAPARRPGRAGRRPGPPARSSRTCCSPTWVRVSRPDLIPQFADLCLQVKGMEWSVVSGITGDEVHISVRNVGYVRAAGDVVRDAFGELGSAGGHRSAAKAVIPASAGRPGSGRSSRRDAAGHRHPLRPRPRRERRDVLSCANGYPCAARPVICWVQTWQRGLRRPRGLGPACEADRPWSTSGGR